MVQGGQGEVRADREGGGSLQAGDDLTAHHVWAM